jgi:hypothetical protein
MNFTEVKNYRGKPVFKQAMEWDGSYESGIEIIRWVVDSGGEAQMTARAGSDLSENYVRLWVTMPEGQASVWCGDFVVAYEPEEEGDFYVCDPGTFNNAWVEKEEN